MNLSYAERNAYRHRSFPRPGEEEFTPSGLLVMDNHDDSLIVFALDAAGQPVDISVDGALTAESSEETVLTADEAKDMRVQTHAVLDGGGPGVKYGTATLTLTVTYGKETTTLAVPAEVAAGPAGGAKITFGAPALVEPEPEGKEKKSHATKAPRSHARAGEAHASHAKAGEHGTHAKSEAHDKTGEHKKNA